MATADKLTYLNATKGLIKDAINNAGANITNDTFRSYATTLGTRITKMRTDYETALSYLPMDTKTNTSISITNAVDLPTYSFKLTKESTQSGTPTPESPIDVNVVEGYRNLLKYPYENTTTEVNGITYTDNGNGTITINGTATANAYFNIYPSEEGKRLKLTTGTYTFSNNNLLPSGITITMSFRNSDGTAMSGVNPIYLNNITKEATRTIEQNGEIFCNILTTNGTTITTPITIFPMLNKGNTALPYVPYGTNWIYTTITDGTNTKNIPMPLNDNEICGIGDYKDEYIVDKNGHCWLNKKTGKVVLDGSENWNYQSLSGNLYVENIVSDKANINTALEYSKCNNYLYFGLINDGLSTLTENNKFAFQTNNSAVYGRVAIRDTRFTSADDFKTWLSTHNTEIYYPLATANLIDLNYNVNLTLYEGTNTITNSETAPMEITYVEDINTILATLTTPSVSE